MKYKAINIIYRHSPSGKVIGRMGEILEVKQYKNGGKYVSDKKIQKAFGKLPILNDEKIREFEEIFC